MTTQRQIESNRQNARNHATGPRTLEGKEASKRNALKHGLAGQGIVLPQDATQAVADRAACWAEEFKPDNPYKAWLVRIAALESIRIEGCFASEAALLSNLAFCATHRWDLDRRVDAETLAAGLRRKPALVSRKLRQSAQGCELLLERWRGLVQVIDVDDDWQENHIALALDLLGIPVELRTDLTLLAMAPESEATGADPMAALRTVALAEIAALEALRAGVLDDLDGAEQGFAELGLGLDDHPAVKRLRRYEADCKRRLFWALNQLQKNDEPIEPIEEPLVSASAPVFEPVASAPPPPEPGTPPAPATQPASTPAPVVHRTLFQGKSLVEAFTPSPGSGNRRIRRAQRKMAMKG